MTWADPRLRAAPMGVVDVPGIVAEWAARHGLPRSAARVSCSRGVLEVAFGRGVPATARRDLAAEIRRAASVTMTPHLASVTVHVGL